MSISSLYDTAKQYADKIMLEQPSFFSGSGGSLCLILTESQEIIFGITSIRISDGRIITVPSEYSAIASMVVENKKKAVQMVILSFYDYSVCQPNAYCLNLLMRAGAENADCQIAVSPEESVSASSILADLAASAENSEAESVPTEFLDGFDFGGENPFDDFVPEPEEVFQPDEQQEDNDSPVQQMQQTAPSGMEGQQINNNPPPQPYGQPFPQQPYMQPFPQQPYMQPQYPQQPYMQPNMNGMDYQQPFPQQPYIPQYPQQPYMQPNMNGMDYQQPYMQQPFPQQPYMPQYPYMQQTFPQQPQGSVYMDNAASYQGGQQGSVQSPVQNSVQGSQYIPENNNSANSMDMSDMEQSIMAKKLASLINDSSRASGAGSQMKNPQQSNEMTKEEMLKRAMQDKKAAKGGFFGKR